MHYERTIKALAKGKHVLLEKPSVSNAAEAELLFKSPLLTKPVPAEVNASANGGPPVLLEAFHYRFQPVWQYFLSLVDRPNLASVHTEALIPSWLFKKDDIRFRYELAGGSMMDLGTYTFSTLRQVFAAEPEACLDCKITKCDPPFELCDYASEATFQFPGGLVGTVKSTLRGSAFSLAIPQIRVTHKPVPAPLVAGEQASASQRPSSIARKPSCELIVTWIVPTVRKGYPGFRHVPRSGAVSRIVCTANTATQIVLTKQMPSGQDGIAA